MTQEILQPNFFEEEPKAETPNSSFDNSQEGSDNQIELVESIEDSILNKHNLDAAIQNCINEKTVREVGTLIANHSTRQPSGYEFSIWEKAGPETFAVFGFEVVPVALSPEQQEMCQRILAPDKFSAKSEELPVNDPVQHSGNVDKDRNGSITTRPDFPDEEDDEVNGYSRSRGGYV